MIVAADIEIQQLFHEELEQLGDIKQICHDPQYADNKLIGHYKQLAVAAEKNLRAMIKMTKISDKQQLYLQQIQQDLESEIEERIKIQKKLAESYRHRQRNQLLVDLAEGIHCFTDLTFKKAHEICLRFPELFHVFYCKFNSWKQTPYTHMLEDAVEIQTAIEMLVAMLQSKAGIIVWEWGDGIGIILPATPTEQHAAQIELALRLNQQIAKQCPQLGITIGISTAPTTLQCFARCCQQARFAATLGYRLDPAQQIYHSQDSQVYQLLHPLSRQPEAIEFVEQTLGKLLAYDQENGTELVTTLNKIISAPTLKIAAEELFVHYKTIISRKQRIEDILTLSLESLNVRFNIAVALHLYQLQRT